LTDTGSADSHWQYDACGNALTNSGSFTPRYTFSTKEFLPSPANGGMYLYAYRVYDPQAGRWTQRDPICYEDSPNLYQFCANNCVNTIDVFGLFSVVFVTDNTTDSDLAEHMKRTDVDYVIHVTSAEQMVNWAESLVWLNGGSTIDRWELSGHGTKWGGVKASSGEINPSWMLPDLQQRMKKTLTANAQFVCWGCWVGLREASLQYISDYYNVTARAYAGPTRWGTLVVPPTPLYKVALYAIVGVLIGEDPSCYIYDYKWVVKRPTKP
jgi:RHS repeat-associated protein